MASVTITEQGTGMDDIGRPVLVFQPGVDMSTVFAGMQVQQLTRIVRGAAGLGWSMAELLGRCFMLKGEPASKVDWPWDGAAPVTLPENSSDREKIRALMEHIVFLADLLNVDSIQIDHPGDPQVGQTYADVLLEQVKALCSSRFDEPGGETREAVLGHINERLYFWDLKIHDVLQNQPLVVHKAYMVGRSLAALRWYLGLRQPVLDEGTLEKVYEEYVPLLSDYLYPFTYNALVDSIKGWGQAIISGQVKPDADGNVPQQLHKQADIWHDLITGSRNPLTFVDPSAEGGRYIWRVLLLAWPIFLIGFLVLLLILAVVLVVLLKNPGGIVAGVTAVGGSLAVAGTTHSVLGNVGGLLQRATTQTGGTVKGSLVDSAWHSTQQKAINKATYLR